MRRSSGVRSEDVALALVIEVHHWIDSLLTGLRTLGVQQQYWRTLELTTDDTIVRAKFLDDGAVPIVDCLCSFVVAHDILLFAVLSRA